MSAAMRGQSGVEGKFVRVSGRKATATVIDGRQLGHGHFTGKVAKNGNSTSLRLEKTFFATHELFDIGTDIEATPIADGVIVIRAVRNPADKETADPVMSAFLDYMENDMKANPESIQPIPKAELDEIAALVEGVEID